MRIARTTSGEAGRALNYDLLAAAEGRPLNYGSMLHASAHAQVTGPCGDSLQIWLKIDGDLIRKASFLSDGCEDAVICCSIAAHTVEGMLLNDAAGLSADDILAAAPPIREDHKHCATLSIDTLNQALATYTVEPEKVPLKQNLKPFAHHEKVNKGNFGHPPPSPGGNHT